VTGRPTVENSTVSTGTLSPEIGERTATVASKGYDYDAFVSYCDADEEWTLSELIKPMQGAGLRVHYKDEFVPGLTLIDAHAQAVERSRRIITVMTPAWCESQWEAFDSSIAQTLSPGSVLPRLIPVLLKPCTLPNRIAALVSLDFSNAALRQGGFDRLLRELGRSAQEITEAATKAVRKGIAALADLLRIPTVQSYLSSFEESIAEASELIGVLGRNKRLHDYFQRAEGAYKLLVRSRKGVAAGVDTWDDLEEVAREVVSELDLLLHFARTGGFPTNEVLWAAKVERLSAELMSAVADQDDARLGRTCERLLEVLATQPARINDKLVTTAGQLALGAVAEKLRKIRAAMMNVPFDDEAGGRLEELRRGTESLARLDGCLSTLINNHNCLQAIDDSLRSFEMTLHPSPAEIAETWIDLGEPLRHLSGDGGAAWVAALQELGAKMDSAVARPPTEPKAVREFQTLFRDVRDKIYRGFNQTDEDLRRFCDQLQKVGETLSAAIGRMRNV
jgi:TIR domain